MQALTRRLDRKPHGAAEVGLGEAVEALRRGERPDLMRAGQGMGPSRPVPPADWRPPLFDPAELEQLGRTAQERLGAAIGSQVEVWEGERLPEIKDLLGEESQAVAARIAPAPGAPAAGRGRGGGGPRARRDAARHGVRRVQSRLRRGVAGGQRARRLALAGV